MGSRSRQRPGEGDETSSEEVATRRRALNERLGLEPEQIEALEKLSKEQRDLWYELVEGWFAPEDWLTAVDAELQKAQPVAAFHVPSAEGVATYRGLFGGNGSLSDSDKEIVIDLLQRAIGGLPTNGADQADNGKKHEPESGKARTSH